MIHRSQKLYEHGAKKEKYGIGLILNISLQVSELLVKMDHDAWSYQTHLVLRKPNHYQAGEASQYSQNLAYVISFYKSESVWHQLHEYQKHFQEQYDGEHFENDEQRICFVLINQYEYP